MFTRLFLVGPAVYGGVMGSQPPLRKRRGRSFQSDTFRREPAVNGGPDGKRAMNGPANMSLRTRKRNIKTGASGWREKASRFLNCDAA